MTRTSDGSAGDADYAVIGQEYRRWRRPEPSFARAITKALGDARTVLNVGAGAGSYEPTDREVTAVEPSAAMRAQRPDTLATAIDATAEDLPFADDTFDAAMTTFSVHQWGDLERGLAEVRRVTRGPVVVLTCDPDRVQDYWLAEYAPEVMATEARRYPALDRIAAALGGEVETTRLPIPFTCVDGFSEAYYARPERLLDPGARLANSAWSFVDEVTARRSVAALRDALDSGEWDRRHGSLRVRPSYDGSLVLLQATPA
ncbi:class I SAM-dependent methyltransferase [Curtobacterium sp. 458]|uniref:class I SAM-dependent methyltransferase n=1 Tax=Curtobacterium sp. 458 TaxID=3050069 RepID=UPI0025B3F7E1|nr:class I SAM-dependent methyltransferase [Curtobacterium sp. 458]WJY01126.1 class I SAM-dependent methyltransferase [Curtobacterium sp. 458]